MYELHAVHNSSGLPGTCLSRPLWDFRPPSPQLLPWAGLDLEATSTVICILQVLYA